MQFKVVYQDSKKTHTIVIESDSLESLQKHKKFPSNVIRIIEVKNYKLSILSSKNLKKEVIEFFIQLDMMLRANVTFSEVIDLLLESEQEKKIKEILEIIKKSLTSSVEIDEALVQYKNILGDTSLLFLKLGFKNGNIKESIHSLVEVLTEDMSSKDKLYETMRYPLILIGSLLISIGMIFIYVLPNFEFIFTLLKDDIPFATNILIFIKGMFDDYFLLILFVTGMFFVLCYWLVLKNRYSFDRFILLKIPIFSKLIQSYYFYRLFLLLSIIVKSKYQFQIAIENSKNIVTNLYVQESMEKVLIHIRNGMSISQAFQKSQLFDSLTMKLLHTADHTNNYESILCDITKLYKKGFQKSLKNFSSVVEPVLILLISLVVLWLILAIMLPIWNLGTVIN